LSACIPVTRIRISIRLASFSQMNMAKGNHNSSRCARK
jgi:hypothetical protein